jgi:excisionase family DNA binding protein
MTPTFDLTIAAAAQSGRCSTRTIRRWIAEGRLPAQRFGPRMIRVSSADLDTLLRPIPTKSGE